MPEVRNAISQALADGRYVLQSGSIADISTRDHDLLTGLTDDDHTIYIKADGTRAFTGDVTMNGDSSRNFFWDKSQGNLNVGVSNDLSGILDFSFGDNVDLTGDYNLGAGQNNSIVADASVVFGSANTVGSGMCVCTGGGNTIDNNSGGATCTGYNNSVENAQFCACLGSANAVDGAEYGLIAGGANTVSGDLGMTAGFLNTNSGDYSIALGVFAQTTGILSIAMGFTVVSSGQGSITIGSSLSNSGEGSVCMGSGYDNSLEYSFNVGWNANQLKIGVSDAFIKITDDDALIIQGHKKIGLVDFTGSGEDDLDTSGTYTGSDTKDYIVEITSGDPADPNVFKWSDDGGSSYTTGVNITGAAQSLSNGVSITFGETTGHETGDIWEFTCYAHTGNLQEWVDGSDDVQMKISNEGIPIVPNLTTTERNALSASNGMIIYNTTTNTLQKYENSSWGDV